jgi:hypothetical protein
MDMMNNSTWFHAAPVCRAFVVAAIVTSGSLSAAPPAQAATACGLATQNLSNACHAEKQDDFSTALASCANFADAKAAKQCRDNANATLSGELALCDQQKVARDAVCALVGQGPYDPDPLSGKTITGATITFVPPESIGNSNAPNPFFSIAPGATTVVRDGLKGEIVAVVHVTDVVREISGQRCRVVADVGMVEAKQNDGTFHYTPSEATDDSYLQAENGDIYYCAEVTRSFDDAGILRDLEGSWQSGLDFGKGGLLIRATPAVGNVDRQEYLPGDAEDIVEYVSLATSPSKAQSGANNLPFPCNDLCLGTREFTAIEPDVNGFKYYLPGVGVVLAADVAGGKIEDREVTQCVGNSIAAGSLLDVLDDASCGIGDPKALLDALCKVSPDAFCVP